MTISYEVKPDEAAIREAVSLFEFVGGQTSDAIRIAINKAAPKIRTKASRAIREQVRLQASYVNERLVIKRATRANLSGRITTPSRGLLLSRFSTDGSVANGTAGSVPKPPARGIRVKVKPTGAAKPVQGDRETQGKPFYIRLKDSGGIGIAARLKKAGSRGGRIKVFHGPSLSQVFSTVRDDVLPEAGREYQAQLLDAMRYLLRKQYPPEAA